METIKRVLFVFSLLAWDTLDLHTSPAQGYVIEWGYATATGVARTPKQVSSNAIAISAGDFLSLALRSDNTVFGWGDNFFGEALGYKTHGPGVTNGLVRVNGQILSNVVSIVAGREWSLALKQDGTVVTWGENYVPAGLTNIAAIAVDKAHSWVLKRDGTVVGWYRELSPSYGLLTAENLSNVVAIAVGPGPQGNTRGVALKRDGTIGYWGGNSAYNNATPPNELSNVVAVAAGASHSLALKSDGTVVGWGWNQYGAATGVPTTNSPNNLDFFSAGQVRIEGQVLSNVTSIAAGRGYSLALKKDGAVVAWGRMVNDLYTPTVPVGLSNVVAVAAGEDFCLAITTNSKVAERFKR